MRRNFLVLALVTWASWPASGQHCPQHSRTSELRWLEGKLVFHDGLRQWFELKLDQPQCGQTSIELMWEGDKSTPLEILRGCRVRSRGIINVLVTGNYAQQVEAVEPVGACSK